MTVAAAKPDLHTVDTAVVACDGGNAGLGHPRVFLTLGADGRAVCPYCSRVFVLAAGAKAGGGH